MSNLMEYNVLNNAKVVRDEISQGKNLKLMNRKCTYYGTSGLKFTKKLLNCVGDIDHDVR